MTFTTLFILLIVGGVHSAALWAATLGAKRFGVPGNVLRWMPLTLGIVSAYVGFPLALRAVTGVELAGAMDYGVGVILGIFAAAGAEVCYRLAWKVIPQLVERAIGRLGHED